MIIDSTNRNGARKLIAETDSVQLSPQSIFEKLPSAKIKTEQISVSIKRTMKSDFRSFATRAAIYQVPRKMRGRSELKRCISISILS